MSKNQRPTGFAGLCLVAVLAIFVTSLAAQTPERVAQQTTASAPSPDAAKPDHDSMMMGQHMMAMRQKMIIDSKAADARLQPLLDKMNRAKGQAKVNAMAAVLTELVHQRADARAQMAQMSQAMPEMMGTMMQGMSEEMRRMSAQCPMMKGSGEAAPKQP